MKNDYSKVFAMLRPVRSGLDGMAGFARIEMRSGKGKMNLSVHGAKAAQDAVLVAALVGNDGISAFECGRLMAGGRGQYSLMYEFDPGDIGGIALDGYTAAAVVLKSGGMAEPLLAGIFGRRGISDWSAAVASLGDKANSALYEEEPRAPGENEKKEEEKKDKEDKENKKEKDGIDENKEKDEKHEKDEKPEDDGKDEKEIDDIDKKPPKKKRKDLEPKDDEEDGGKDEGESDEDGKEGTAKDVFKVDDDYAPVEKPVRLCAEDLVWQGYSYAMKPLFLKHSAVEPFGEIENMLFVRVDMPVKSAGADHYILGAKAKGDEVERLCIGVPGRGGVIPPAGLEGSQWKSDGRGAGYWLSWQDAYMGYPIRGDF